MTFDSNGRLETEGTSETGAFDVVAHLHSLCRREGKCLLWTRAADGAGVPIVRLPGAKKVHQARRVLMQALGRDMQGLLATTRCGNPLCMDPAHCVAWTRKKLQKRSGQKFTGNVARAARLATVRRRTAVLSMEKVREMRSRGLTGKQAAAEYGCSEAAAHKALSGATWKEYGSPFGGFR